jgi:ABC-type glycerol-3-phosphate transport system substrate-binding protein
MLGRSGSRETRFAAFAAFAFVIAAVLAACGGGSPERAASDSAALGSTTVDSPGSAESRATLAQVDGETSDSA